MKLWHQILLIIMLTSILPLTGCGKSDVPRQTSQQVISIIQVYGVPYSSYYEGVVGSPQPVGQWAAVYEGDGQWRVQGAVVTRYDGKDYYYSTTWTYKSTEIRLIRISGEPPPTTPTAPSSYEEELKRIKEGR